jgi:hypothetical protein
VISIEAASKTSISRYSELAQWADAFMKAGGLKLMFLVGNPGTAR